VACPTHVMVASLPFDRRAAPSFGTRGSDTVRGEKVLAQMRATKNRVRVQKGGRATSGFVLAKPCWR